MTSPQADNPDVLPDAQDIARRIRARLPEHVEFLLFAYSDDGRVKSVMSATDVAEVTPMVRRWLVQVGDIEALDRPHSVEGLALARLVQWAAQHEGIPDSLDPERRVDSIINRIRYIRERYAKDVTPENKLIADPESAPREGTIPDLALAYLRVAAQAFHEGDTDGLNKIFHHLPQALL